MSPIRPSADRHIEDLVQAGTEDHVRSGRWTEVRVSAKPTLRAAAVFCRVRYPLDDELDFQSLTHELYGLLRSAHESLFGLRENPL